MGDKTKIEWTTHTFNPWWGCTRVSPGCEHCYAEAFAKRTGLGWGVGAERRFFTDKHWNEPRKWNAAAEKAGERRRVFCASMADVFEDRRELDAPRARLFRLIADTPWLDWQLLTKRPENVDGLMPGEYDNGWPANVWLGATAEDQKRADARWEILSQIDARVRFLSCEPLLGPVTFAHWATVPDWVIVGGESGARARMFETRWADSLVRECRAARVAVFVKQLGAHAVPVSGMTPLRLHDPKGGDWDEWPADLRVREFPRSLAWPGEGE